MGEVVAVCISEKKGTAKQNIGECKFIENFGLEKDAHAGNWHRQVSLLSFEEVEKFRSRGADVKEGAFGENLLVKGFDFKTYPIGTIFKCNDVVLEITQIGKQCHSECEIFHMVGDCIMPREGVFARVLHSGTIKVGDELEVIEKNGHTAAVITASDKGSRGEREDKSGPLASTILKLAGYEVLGLSIVPDDEDKIYNEIIKWCDDKNANLVFTTGGTGFSPRDNTPEATLRAATKNASGIAQAMRYYSLGITPKAMLSRAESVIRNRSLIINLPGSPKAVKECLEYILPALSHGVEILLQETAECAEK